MYIVKCEHKNTHLQEQVEWAVQEGADFIIAETFGVLAEAKLALQCIKEVKKGQKYA